MNLFSLIIDNYQDFFTIIALSFQLNLYQFIINSINQKAIVMKKLLFLLLAVILPMAISAQLLDNNRDFKRSPYALKVFNQHQLMTTSRADLAANQMIMGHYDTDDVASSGEGIGLNTTGKRQVGTVITPEEVAVFQGGKIVKFRVGLANAASISKVLIAKVSAAGAVGSLQQITCSANAAGWNEITLSSPYTISLNSTQGLFIGFEYQQTAGQYPLSAVKVGDIYPTLWKNGLNWQDLGSRVTTSPSTWSMSTVSLLKNSSSWAMILSSHSRPRILPPQQSLPVLAPMMCSLTDNS